MRSTLVKARTLLIGRNVAFGIGLSIAIACSAVAFMMIIHMLFNVLGIGEVGIWFYGSIDSANWGLNFFNLGGLELNGPDGISFYSCTGQC